jgi:hypothetical protein
MDLSMLKSIDAKEISSIIEKAALFGGKIAQPTLTSNFITSIKSIDITKGQIKIKLFEDAPLEITRPISIKLNYRSINFNLDPRQYTVSGNTITTSLPTEAKALEIRPDERHILPHTAKIETGIYRIEKRSSRGDIKSTIIDVSPKGLGLLISRIEDEMILKHDHLWIRSINNIKLDKPIFGRVVYVLQRNYKDQADLKVGVSLDEEIPEEILKELQQMCKLVLSA